MNLVLLFPDDFVSRDCAIVRDQRRISHLLTIQKVRHGDRLRVGRVNGDIGSGTVAHIASDAIELQLALHSPPPKANPISVILALPRPPMLKRTLQTIATLGVKQLLLLQSARVEKSFWQSPQLRESKIREELTLGLEQGCDTVLPQVEFAQRFRPFIEDQLERFVAGRKALIAHPYATANCPRGIGEPSVLAIGPEGGFLDKELDAFTQRGFTGVTLGPRVMRVETVVPYLLGRLSS